MALLQIAEPDKALSPISGAGCRNRPGHYQLLVAALRSGVTAPLADADGQVILPSVVRYHADRVEVGACAKRAAAADPFNTISSVKRLMGRGLADVKQLGEQLPYRFRQAESQMPFIETVQGPRARWKSRRRSCGRCASAPRRRWVASWSGR